MAHVRKAKESSGLGASISCYEIKTALFWTRPSEERKQMDDDKQQQRQDIFGRSSYRQSSALGDIPKFTMVLASNNLEDNSC